MANYSYEINRHSNGEVSWCVFRHEGAATFVPYGAMGFGHSYAMACWPEADRTIRQAAALDAECQAFDAVMRRLAA